MIDIFEAIDKVKEQIAEIDSKVKAISSVANKDNIYSLKPEIEWLIYDCNKIKSTLTSLTKALENEYESLLQKIESNLSYLKSLNDSVDDWLAKLTDILDAILETSGKVKRLKE